MRRFFLLAALFGALVLASLASTARAAPLAGHFHVVFSDHGFADNQCGIDGSGDFDSVNNTQIFADGTSKVEGRVRRVFTSAATGKSVLLFYAFQRLAPGSGVENGDGTITYSESTRGLSEKLKLLNGPVLSRDAGFFTVNDIFDPTIGDFVGQTISPEHGPHPDLDSGFTLFCDVIVPALS